MSVSKLANRILEDFLDLDRLTYEECLNYTQGRRSRQIFTEAQCKALSEALGPGLEAEITPSEIALLRRLGVSEKLTTEIGGKDGKEALRRRARWLGEFYLNPDPLVPSRVVEGVRNEIFNIGAQAPGALKALIKILGEKDMRAAAAAAEILGRMGPAAKEAVPALSRLIVNMQPVTAEAEQKGEFDDAAFTAGVARISAVKALGKIGEERGLAALMSALNDDYKGIRPYAAESIGKIGKVKGIKGPVQGAIRDLILVSQDDDPKLRETVAKAFAEMDVQRPLIVRWLIAILQDEDKSKEHRAYAARALGRMGRDAAHAVTELKKILQSDPDMILREDAAYALVQIGTKEALLALKAAGTEESIAALIEGLSSQSVGVRRACAALLEHMGDASAVEALIESLSEAKEDEDVRRRAAQALGVIADAAAVPALIDAVSHDSSEVAASSARALGRIGSDKIGRHADRAVKPLIALYSRSDFKAKEFAAYALGTLGSKARPAMETLSEGLTHSSKQIHEMTAIAMIRIDAARAVKEIKELGSSAYYLVPVLTRGLANDSDTIKRACAMLLSQYGAEAAAAVPALIREMGSVRDRLLKEQMISTLGSIGPAAGDAVAPIIEAYGSGNERLRVAAIKALADIDGLSMATLPLVLLASRDKSRRVRRAAEEALRGADVALLAPGLITVIARDDKSIVKPAVDTLNRIPHSELVPLLAKILADSDSDPGECALVISGLGKIALNNAEAVLALAGGLVSRNADVSRESFKALYNLGSKAAPAEPALRALLTFDNQTVRRTAKILLDMIDSHAEKSSQAPSAPAPVPATPVVPATPAAPPDAAPVPAPVPTPVPAETPAASEVEKLIADLESSNLGVRLKAASALSKMKPEAVKAAAPAVAALLEHGDHGVRSAAAFVLGSSGSAASPALPALYKTMRGDKEESVRRECEKAIAMIATADIAKQSLQAVKSKDPFIREVGIYVVARVGPSAAKATPDLVKALEGSDERIAVMAAEALGAVNSAAAGKALASAITKAGFRLRMAIAKALTETGPDAQMAAKPELIKISLGQDQQARDVANYILGKITP